MKALEIGKKQNLRILLMEALNSADKNISKYQNL